MLNYRQLSAMFPVCPNGESSDQAWASLLKQWREVGKLELRKHWRYGPSIEGNNQPTRYYDAPKVVRLICTEARLNDRRRQPRPRIAYLYAEYYDAFAAILTEANAEKTAREQQAIIPGLS